MSLYLTFWSPEFIIKTLLLGVSKCSSWRLSAELPKFHRLVTTKIFSALSGNFLLVAAGPGRSGQVVPAGGRGYYGWWPYYPTTPTHTLCLLTSGYVALCWRGWAPRGRGQCERRCEAAAGWAEVRAAAERPTAWLLTRPVEATRHSDTAPQPLCNLCLSSTLRHHPYIHLTFLFCWLFMKSDCEYKYLWWQLPCVCDPWHRNNRDSDSGSLSRDFISNSLPILDLWIIYSAVWSKRFM